jgi:hypothetical protein
MRFMGTERFDTLLVALTTAPSRRAALRLLGGLGLSGRFGQIAAKKRKGKKKKCAKAGQATSKKRKKCCKGLGRDATGRCAPPSSSCTPGCGGPLSCGCPANQICLRSGACQPCDVTCTGTPAACGAALQTAMNGGGTVYVCPGRYQGGFTLSPPLATLRVIGAGEGLDAASNTILDANDRGGVLDIATGVGTVALERLRITDGNGALYGAGIKHQATMLRMTECTVSGNTSVEGPNGGGGTAGGISTDFMSTLEMTRCTVRDNHAIGTFGNGGGIWTSGTTILTDCLIENNTATNAGGGLFVDDGTTTLAGSTQVRDNVTNPSNLPNAGFGGGILNRLTLVIAETCRVTGNTAPPNKGGGIWNETLFTAVTLDGADPSPIVVNNCHENCVNVPECAAEPVSC